MGHEPPLAKATKISDQVEIVSLDPGEFLFREGDPGDALYIVNSGLLRIVSGSTVYETVKPGGIVGEMAIVEHGLRRSASVIAGTRVELTRRLREQLLSIARQYDAAAGSIEQELRLRAIETPARP